ncbi:MAG: hypothetical protein IKF71_02735 [Bacilli bacterium]|nr:hypothetical protein [Bacilli bacterium]
MSTQVDYNEVLERTFPGNPNIEIILEKTPRKLMEVLFENKEKSYEDVMAFLEKYKEEVITCSLKDESLISELLKENQIIDRTKKNTITREYFESIMEKIKNKDFDEKSVAFYLNVLNMCILCSKYTEEEIKNILNGDIYNIATNDIYMSNSDRDHSTEHKVELMDKLISWKEKCGEDILPEIFHLETLKENIITLINSLQIRDDERMQAFLQERLDICDHAIRIRDGKELPSNKLLNEIPFLFADYNEVNKLILYRELDSGKVQLVHFVRNGMVDFQTRGENVINFSDSQENGYGKEQVDILMEGFMEYIKQKYEREKGKDADLEDPEYRDARELGLRVLNNTLNFRPLDRLPVKCLSKGANGVTEIRKASHRVSCSLVSSATPKFELDKKIGIIIMPYAPEAFTSMSLGYTYQSDINNFNRDGRTCTRIIYDAENGDFYNEICVDMTKCYTDGIALFSDDEQIIAKAEALAKTYRVPIINMMPEKEDTGRKRK